LRPLSRGQWSLWGVGCPVSEGFSPRNKRIHELGRPGKIIILESDCLYVDVHAGSVPFVGRVGHHFEGIVNYQGRKNESVNSSCFGTTHLCWNT
jgi:hypothetical protein